jgi:hypothetical protein
MATNQYRFNRLASLWALSDFRQSIGAVVALEAETHLLLRRLTDADFAVSDAAALDVDPTELANVLAASRELYDSTLDGAAAEDVLDELTQLAAINGADLPPNFQDQLAARRSSLLVLLSPRDEYNRRQWRETVQRSGQAALDGVSLFVDLRPTTISGSSRLVPVILARLEFDEPIQTLSRAVVFQVSDSGLKELRAAMERLDQALADITSTHKDSLL